MATETATLPVNGIYHGPDSQLYGEETRLRASSAADSRPEQQHHPDVPKDQVAWYFVEQYYTTLSRSPERLHLFFTKRSQFVSGVEAEKEAVCTGQKAIGERIKELSFHEAKVRVTNVDSQVSGDNIVIQVVGAMSNNSEPSRKFVQTFVLAAQTNGYFVLNDIFRYLFDEDEDTVPDDESPEMTQMTAVQAGVQEPVPTAEESEPKGLTSSTDPAAQEHDADLVDKELEEVILDDASATGPTPTAAVNGTPDVEPADVAHGDDVQAAAVEAPVPTHVEPAQEATQSEKPKDPVPSPAAPPKEAQKPAPPAKPAVPKTWAQLASSGSRTAAPAASVSAATSSTAPQAKQSQSQQAPQSTQASAPVVSPTVPAREPSPGEGSQEGSSGGWQAVGADHKRQQSRSQGPQAGENERVRAYVRNVYLDITPDELKSALSKFGPIPYCDINRQKNSAFVEFSTRAGFQAAVNANPHKLSGHELFVEERRVNALPNNRANPRGNRTSFDGRAPGQGRGGSFNKDSNRGGVAPRGRGGNPAPRARGTA